MKSIHPTPASASDIPDAVRRGVLGYVPEIVRRYFYPHVITLRVTRPPRGELLDRIRRTTWTKYVEINTSPKYLQQRSGFLRRFPLRLKVYGATAETVKLLLDCVKTLPVPRGEEAGFRLTYVEIAADLVTRTEYDAIALAWYFRARVVQPWSLCRPLVDTNTFYTARGKSPRRIAEYHNDEAKKLSDEPTVHIELRVRGSRRLRKLGIALSMLASPERLADIIREHVQLREVDWRLLGLQSIHNPRGKQELLKCSYRYGGPRIDWDRRNGHNAMVAWCDESVLNDRMIQELRTWCAQEVKYGLRNEPWFRWESVLRPVDNSRIFG